MELSNMSYGRLSTINEVVLKLLNLANFRESATTSSNFIWDPKLQRCCACTITAPLKLCNTWQQELISRREVHELQGEEFGPKQLHLAS